MGELSGQRIVLGVTGGIAAYKAAELTSRLKKRGAGVRVVMTENACRFVAPATFEAISGNAVALHQFEHSFDIEHVALSKWATLFVVAPATANFLGKLASGIADDLLTTVAMAMPAPTMIAPAMNTAMWRAAATQENVERLRARGVLFVGPAKGLLACGDDDIGRMSEPTEIEEAIASFFAHGRDLAGKRILVTAGPTREMIDPVRYLTNRSSGKMGYAIAEAAAKRGASVTLVSGPVALSAPAGTKLIPILSTQSLYEAVMAVSDEHDAIIQAAAPADFTPTVVADKKIKKTGAGMAIPLAQTPDIARTLGERKRAGQVLVAFAAETDDALAHARDKRVRKNADLIVVNDVTQPGAGFDVDTNRVTLIDDTGEEELPLMTKRQVADFILDRVARLL